MIGGQLDAGFVLVDMFEDRDDGALSKFVFRRMTQIWRTDADRTVRRTPTIQRGFCRVVVGDWAFKCSWLSAGNLPKVRQR